MYFDNCRSIDEGKKVYRRLAMQNHPDRGGDTAVMAAINTAWERFQKYGGFSAGQSSANYNREPERKAYTAPRKPRRKTFYTQKAYDNMKNDSSWVWRYIDNVTVFYKPGMKTVVMKFDHYDSDGEKLYTARQYNDMPKKYANVIFGF